MPGRRRCGGQRGRGQAGRGQGARGQGARGQGARGQGARGQGVVGGRVVGWGAGRDAIEGGAEDDSGHHAVAAAGQQGQAGAGLRFGLGLGQDAPPGGDHRVGRQHETPRRIHRSRLGPRQTFGVQARQLVRQRGFVDLGRMDAVGRDADLRQQCQPSRAADARTSLCSFT